MTFERMMDRLNKEKGRTAGEDNPPGVMRTLFVDDLSLSFMSIALLSNKRFASRSCAYMDNESHVLRKFVFFARYLLAG